MTARFDVLVIGAGVAGLRAAIELAERGRQVLVVTKDTPEDSSSGWAMGGIAVALGGGEEELVLHEEDTLRAGAGLCDREAVRILVREGREEVLRLIASGARFDRQGERYHLTREAAHSEPRILHSGGDATGREIVRTLVAEVRRQPRVTRWPSAIAASLVVDRGRCCGAFVIDAEGERRRVESGAVLLATGGIGQCWGVTSNPPEATGDGIALALGAGCRLADMEFVQFHPTALAVAGKPPLLLTEALRGEGGVVRNREGVRFLLANSPEAELAPRDVVARGIAREIARQSGAPVFLDLSPIGADRLEQRFPGVVAACRTAGLDPLHDSIPIRPAAHYAMGGVQTDLDGATSVPGLFAAGEVASNGVHGANRLASNSLLEGLVFGARAARKIIAHEAEPIAPLERDLPPPRSVPSERLPQQRGIADRHLGIMRNGADLEAALGQLEELLETAERTPWARLERKDLITANVALTLRSVARAALWRRESRGAHFREDTPDLDDRRFGRHSLQDAAGIIESDGTTD